MALIKYWGKRDEKLILPINSSLSVTVSQKNITTTTTAQVSKTFQEDRFWLNGVEQDIHLERLQNCLRGIRKLIKGPEREWNIHICSENNFPTGAGLASSAAGYACLVFTLAHLFGIKEELSIMARLGSGSACRSIYGGFVEWLKGEKDDGTDSIAVQVKDENWWPELQMLILVVSSKEKETSSTSGMETSVETSELLQHRAEVIVPKRMDAAKQAILAKNFQQLAEIIMKDSNQFHATCLDTFPPIFYLNETSKKIIHLITKYNEFSKSYKAAYTFDAGPNAVIFTTTDNLPNVLYIIHHYFPLPLKKYPEHFTNDLSTEMIKRLDRAGCVVCEGALQDIIHTEIGPGPQVLDPIRFSLLDEGGLPKKGKTK